MELFLRNKKLDYFDNVEVTMSFDAIASTFGFGFYFNVENNIQRDLAVMGLYPDCRVEENGEVLIYGTIVSNSFNSNPSKSVLPITGYSKTGVLQDCTAPLETYPLQSDNLSLKEIAQKFTKPYGIGIVIDSEVASRMNEKFDVSKLKPTEVIGSYLSSLASQKNIVLTHDNKGNIAFTTAKTNGKPIAHFETALGMSLDIDGQSMHRNITVMKQADVDGGNAGQESIINPFVKTNRSKIVVQSSGSDNDTKLAVRSALGQELKAIKLVINLNTWLDDNGNIWKPNNTITVINKELFIFEKTKFFIESVKLQQNKSGKSAVLNCYLPAVYDNSTPINFFEKYQ